jgi:hypothetical protein
MNHINKIVDHNLILHLWNLVSDIVVDNVCDRVGKTVAVNVYFTIKINVEFNVSKKSPLLINYLIIILYNNTRIIYEKLL